MSSSITPNEDSIAYQPVANTCGYDFHFVINEGDIERARALKEECCEFLNANQSGFGGYVTTNHLSAKAVGPWQQAMWVVTLCTVDGEDKATAQALDEAKNKRLHQLMKKTAEFLQQRMQEQQLSGGLFIHANEWPPNSDQVFERALHFKHAWTVIGEVTLNDIWHGAGGLIAMEAFVKKSIEQRLDDEQIAIHFLDKFKHSEVFPDEEQRQRLARVLTEAQHNLKQLCRVHRVHQ